MKHLDELNRHNRIEVRMPYKQITYGDAYFTLYKDSDMSKEDFLAGLRDGSIDPFEFSTYDPWMERCGGGGVEFWQPEDLEDMDP